MLHFNANRPENSKSANIKELGSKVVPVHALKAYRWSRSIAPFIGEPKIFLGGWGEGVDPETRISLGGEGVTLSPELFGGGWP
jgi:hypothetical protein